MLEHLALELDQLLFLDKNCELAADRDTIIRIANNEALFPANLREIAILETAKHLGRRVKAFDGGRRLSWRDGARHGLPSEPASADDFRKLGVTESTSQEELGVLLMKRFPDLPASLTEPAPAELYATVLKNLTLNRTFWDCLVANLRWWAAVNFIGSGLVLIALLGAGVPWQGALACAIAFSGVLTGLCHCTMRPQSVVSAVLSQVLARDGVIGGQRPPLALCDADGQ